MKTQKTLSRWDSMSTKLSFSQTWTTWASGLHFTRTSFEFKSAWLSIKSKESSASAIRTQSGRLVSLLLKLPQPSPPLFQIFSGHRKCNAWFLVLSTRIPILEWLETSLRDSDSQNQPWCTRHFSQHCKELSPRCRLATRTPQFSLPIHPSRLKPRSTSTHFPAVERLSKSTESLEATQKSMCLSSWWNSFWRTTSSWKRSALDIPKVKFSVVRSKRWRLTPCSLSSLSISCRGKTLQTKFWSNSWRRGS